MKISCKDFDLKATLESGQVFGFTKDPAGAYDGVLLGHPVRLRQTNEVLRVERISTERTTSQTEQKGHVRNSNVSLLRRSRPFGTWSGSVVRDYFDLDRDLKGIFSLLRGDPVLQPAFKTFKGLRLIHQDPWEALACFILSSNNNIKRIMGIYRGLVRHFGYFPSPSDIARSHERVLRGLGLGYRAPFIFKTAVFLSTNPGYLGMVREADYENAKERVLAFPGIGPKVADCVLLYGFHKLEAFPVDVWILRIMRRLYFRNRKVSEDKVRAFGMKRWGKDAGYVQQYLFHSARMSVYDILKK